MIKIKSKDGITIYGELINNSKRIGRFTVFCDVNGQDDRTFYLLSEAEAVMDSILSQRQKR